MNEVDNPVEKVFIAVEELDGIEEIDGILNLVIYLEQCSSIKNFGI